MSAPTAGGCVEMERLLAERASGPLDAPEAAALTRHLLGCASCRAAAGHWEELFSLVALAPPTLREEAAMRDLPKRTLLAWRLREDRFKRAPGWVAGALLAAAAVVLVLWHAPSGQGGGPPPAVVAEAARPPSAPPQLDWTDGPTWEMDEFDATEGASDDGTLLDGLALEGDGAFSLGDSG
jgi:anti-sigma factor RsiW